MLSVEFAQSPSPIFKLTLEIRILRWFQCIDGSAPGVEFCEQCLDSIWLVGSEILLFAGIGGDVVEFRLFSPVENNELPVAIAHYGTGDTALIAPMWIVPEQWLALDGG